MMTPYIHGQPVHGKPKTTMNRNDVLVFSPDRSYESTIPENFHAPTMPHVEVIGVGRKKRVTAISFRRWQFEGKDESGREGEQGPVHIEIRSEVVGEAEYRSDELDRLVAQAQALVWERMQEPIESVPGDALDLA